VYGDKYDVVALPSDLSIFKEGTACSTGTSRTCPQAQLPQLRELLLPLRRLLGGRFGLDSCPPPPSLFRVETAGVVVARLIEQQASILVRIDREAWIL
jgi:hypothetical protein